MVDALALFFRTHLDLAPPAAMLQQALHAWRDCDLGCLDQPLGSLIRKRLARRLPRVDLDEAEISIGGTTALSIEVSLWYGAADPGNPDELANADPDVTDALEELVLFGVRPSVSRDIEALSGLQGSESVFKFTARWRVPAETARTAIDPAVLTAARLAVLERLVQERAALEPRYVETYLERRRRRHVRLLQQQEEEKRMSITPPTQPPAPLPMREWQTGQAVYHADYSQTLTIRQGIVKAAGPRRVTVEYEVGNGRAEERLEVEYSPRGWASTEDAAVQLLKDSLRKEEERLTEQLDKLHRFQRTYLGRPLRLQEVLGALADAEAMAVWAVLGEVLEDDADAAEQGVQAAADRLALLKPVEERLNEVLAALEAAVDATPPRSDAPLRITTDRGVPFTVRVEEGKRPLMVFFDMRYTEKFGPKGQKVAEYYADTLAQSRDGAGLALRMGNPDWTIDGPALGPVLALARTLNPAR